MVAPTMYDDGFTERLDKLGSGMQKVLPIGRTFYYMITGAAGAFLRC